MIHYRPVFNKLQYDSVLKRSTIVFVIFFTNEAYFISQHIARKRFPSCAETPSLGSASDLQEVSCTLFSITGK